MNKYWWGLSAVLLLVTAWCSVGHHQGDEHFQILEFAAYKLGQATADDLAWEFTERMRPALQPALAYLVYRSMDAVGAGDPFWVAFVLRLFSAAFTFCIARLLYVRFRPLIEPAYATAVMVALLFHWCAYYNGVRFSSENWSGLTAVLGFLIYPLAGSTDERRLTPSGGGSALLSGICFGFAFLFRYQIALLVVGFGAWLLFIYRERWQRVTTTVVGGLLTLLLAYPLTYWLYGEWTLPAWNYLAANLIEGRAATYGTEPWYGYFTLVFLRGIPPLSLVYLFATLIFAYHYRRDPVAWMTVAFVGLHSVLARKDVRFLFPLIPLLPVLLLGALRFVQQRYGAGVWKRKWLRFASWLLLAVNLILLLTVLFRPAHSGIKPARYLYTHFRGSLTVTGPTAPLFLAEETAPRFFFRDTYRVVPSADDAFTCGPAEFPCVYVEHTRRRPELPAGSQLLYTDRSALVEAVNVLGWADREKWWYVYLLP